MEPRLIALLDKDTMSDPVHFKPAKARKPDTLYLIDFLNRIGLAPVPPLAVSVYGAGRTDMLNILHILTHSNMSGLAPACP
jgi:hypothetical protein